MLIKSIKNTQNITKVTIQYVGNRERTFLLDQNDLDEFDKSYYQTLGEFIGSKHGTDFPDDKTMKMINSRTSVQL